jgi:hypothetical protein
LLSYKTQSPAFISSNIISTYTIIFIKKGSSHLHRVREGSDHFESYVCRFSLHFSKRLLPGFEPMTSW